jgi:transcriptional regulator with XRE-family HTH domain
MSKTREVRGKEKESAGRRNLGLRLRTLRTRNTLTLDQLSRLSGVSKAMLSQIEQNQVNPTVVVMLKIADALQVNLSELVQAGEPGNIYRIISREDDHYSFRKDRRVTIRTLSPLNLEKNIEFYRITLEKGGELKSEPHYPGVEEILYVAEGRLAVTSGHQTVEIGEGDSIHYRADVPHALCNRGPGPVELYVIARYKGA